MEPSAGSITAYEKFKQQRFFGSLNGLRFIAIVAVLWHHIAATSFSITLAYRGTEGVTLFFAISGFLITTLLLREKSRNRDIDMKKFFMRRTLRIFPLYYTMLAVYAVLVFFTAEPVRFENFFANFLSFATYTSNFFMVDAVVGGTMFAFAWSLATEEQFYLIWPWIEKQPHGGIRAMHSRQLESGTKKISLSSGFGVDSRSHKESF